MLRHSLGGAARRTLANKRWSSIQTGPLLETTTLPSGLRIATDSTAGHFAAVGVYVNAGSRYESAPTLGFSHLLDRMTYSVRMATESGQVPAHETYAVVNRPAKIGRASNLQRKRQL